MPTALTPEAIAARRLYHRNWNRDHPDVIKAASARRTKNLRDANKTTKSNQFMCLECNMVFNEFDEAVLAGRKVTKCRVICSSCL